MFRAEFRMPASSRRRDDRAVGGALASLTLNMFCEKKFAEAEPLPGMLAIDEKLYPNHWFLFCGQRAGRMLTVRRTHTQRPAAARSRLPRPEAALR